MSTASKAAYNSGAAMAFLAGLCGYSMWGALERADWLSAILPALGVLVFSPVAALSFWYAFYVAREQEKGAGE